MRRPSIFLKTVRDLRWQVFWYGLGIALMAALVVYIYPSYSDQLEDFEVPEALRGLVGDVDITSGPGFLTAEFFSWMPLILAVFAITSGTRALGEEEATGSLDLLLAQPISRARLAIEKLAGTLASAVMIMVIIYAGWLVSVPFVDIDVGLDDLLLATFNLLPLVLFFQALGCIASVTLATRGAATGAVTAFAVASYFVHYLAGIVEAIEPARVVSVFYHQHGTEVLTDGLHWGGLALLLGLTVAVSVAAVLAFQRREIGSGRSSIALPWLRRGRPEPAS
jgi:beta-exotoxin I transport system permease protein